MQFWYHPELGQSTQVKGTYSEDCPHFRHQLQAGGFPGHLHVWNNWIPIWSFHPCPQVQNFLESLTELLNAIYKMTVLLGQKRIQMKTSQKKKCTRWSPRESQTGSMCPLPMESGCVALLAHCCVTVCPVLLTREYQCPEFWFCWA